MKTRITYLLRLVSICMTLLITVGACEEKGALEKAGKSVDKKLEEAGEKVEDATDKAADSIEEAGDDIKHETTH